MRALDAAARASLPEDDEVRAERAVMRLRVATLVFAIGSLVNSLPNWLIPPETRRDFTAVTYRVLEAHAVVVTASVLVALAAFVFFSLRSIPAPTRKLGGHAFVVLAAAATAIATHLQPRTGVTWVGVLILSFPLLVPTRPRSALLTLSLASFTSPAALQLAYAFGFRDAPPSLGALAVSLVPNLICLGIGLFGAHVITELGDELRSAKALGSYVLDERIGSGGMGEVWRARHRLLKRPAAVKLIRTSVVDMAAARRRFEREARLTSTLSSPHSIRIFDFGTEADGTLYLVMELLTGSNVQELVEHEGPMSVARARHLLLQACSALEEAHETGVVHRDIKPSNLFVGRRGAQPDFLTVLDFGLSKCVHGRDAKLTGDDDLIGTPSFIAPEQALGLAPVDGRCDIYALGAVGYFMMTGCLVFDSDHPVQVVMQHIHDAPAPPSTRTELPIPPAVDETLLRCLTKEPRERPTVVELAREMAAWTV